MNYPGLLTLDGNLMAAVDIETTGLLAGFHEVIQIAVQPLDAHLEPLKDVLPFYTNIQPEHFNRINNESMRVHGINLTDLRTAALDKWKVADLFDDWVQKLDLPYRKSLIPLAHNWAFESGFLKHWLGLESFNQLFHPHPRDTMILALSIADRAAFRGEDSPFNRYGLKSLCNTLGIPFIGHHDALADALATAQLYRTLMTLNIP